MDFEPESWYVECLRHAFDAAADGGAYRDGLVSIGVLADLYDLKKIHDGRPDSFVATYYPSLLPVFEAWDELPAPVVRDCEARTTRNEMAMKLAEPVLR